MPIRRKEIIELLSMDYSEEAVIQAIDKLIQQQRLDPSKLPDNFADQVITSFEIAEEGKRTLSSGEMTVAPPSQINLQKAESLGIPHAMLQLTAQVVLGKLDSQIDNLFDAASLLINQKFDAGCNRIGRSILESALSQEVVGAEQILQSSGIKTPVIEENSQALSDYLASLNIEQKPNQNITDIAENLYQHHASK